MKEELNGLETYFYSWLQGWEGLGTMDVVKITKLLYEHISSPVGLDLEAFEQKYSSLADGTTLQSVASPLVEAFLNLHIGSVGEAYANVRWVEKLTQFIQERHSDPASNEYCSGLEYMCELITVHARLLDGTATTAVAQAIRKSCLKYEGLASRGKAVVWMSKWMLNQPIDGRHVEAADALEKVCKYEYLHSITILSVLLLIHSNREIV
jgi:hypothetical protein